MSPGSKPIDRFCKKNTLRVGGFEQACESYVIATYLPQSDISTRATMAWRCTGNTNVELVTNLMHHGLINSESVAAVRASPPISTDDSDILFLQAMRSVDRANYVLDKRHAYEDSPQCVPSDSIFTPSSFTQTPNPISH